MALPLPPIALRHLVALNVDDSSFIETGRREARMVRDTLEAQGLRMDDMGAVLEFGCGCGRILRHWEHIAGNVQIHGSDYNSDLVAWCREHLPFAAFSLNPALPPLVYHSGKFDFVLAFSVFTHLPEPAQPAWMGELARVTKPGGHLLFTTHGDSYVHHLSPEDSAVFDRGEIVYVGADPGSNAFNVFHPPRAVRRLFSDLFEIVSHVPGVGAYHDVWLARRRRPHDGAGARAGSPLRRSFHERLSGIRRRFGGASSAEAL